jgi:tetratricopeptide (TPR) repeat protein
LIKSILMKRLFYNRKHILRRFILLLILLAAGPVMARTYGSTLTPGVEVDYERGIAAAEQGEWGLAVAYFNKAQWKALGSPGVLFNLALACSNAGGRDVLAIAWFKAYLAVAPNAANAEQVRKEVLKLEIRVEATVRKLFGKANDTAAMVVNDSDRAKAYGEIVYARIQVGDIAGAREAASLIPDIFPNHHRFSAYSQVVRAQAGASLFKGALDTATLLEDGYKQNAYSNIADAQIKAGGIAGAIKTAALMESSTYERASIYRSIALVQVEAGDIAGARKTASLITYDEYAFRAIVKAQVKAGDIVGALETSALIEDVGEKDESYKHIATAQIGAGDIDEAMDIAALITDNSWDQINVYSCIVKYRAASGDMDGAFEVIEEKIEDPEKQYIAYGYIAIVQAEAGDIEEAIDTATLITKDYYVQKAYKAISKAQAIAGDMDGARNSAALAGTGKGIANIYTEISKARFEAGDKRVADKYFALGIEASADLFETDAYDGYVFDIIKARARAGDIVRARKMAALVPNREWKAIAYYHIVELQIEVGDIEGARETAALIEDGNVNKRIAEKIDIPRALAMPDPEVRSRVELAIKYRGEPLFDDLPKFLKLLTAEESGDVAVALADAATDLTEALKELQENDVKWQGSLAESTP